jgi:hypothetical protein
LKTGRKPGQIPKVFWLNLLFSCDASKIVSKEKSGLSVYQQLNSSHTTFAQTGKSRGQMINRELLEKFTGVSP